MKIMQEKRVWLRLGLATLAITTLFALYFTGPLRWLGAPTVAILSSPTRVESFKLSGSIYQPNPTLKTIGGYPILSRGRQIDKYTSAQLGRSLLSPEDYLFGDFDMAACRISPGIGFRFWKDKQSVDVAVCFLCGHILIDTRDDKDKIVHSYLAPFSVQRLTGFVRTSFPNDRDMQGTLSTYEVHEK